MPDADQTLSPTPSRPVRPSRLARAAVLGLLLAVVAPLPVHADEPTWVTVRVNVYRPYTAVRQYTNYWCVPANAQMMINIIRGTEDRTYRTQLHYYNMTRRNNRYRYRTLGNDVQGWAWLLDSRLPGPLHYDDRMYSRQSIAILRIVEAIDRTHHPVGVVVDRGRHAWTVVGYRARQIEGRPKTRVIEGLYVFGSLKGAASEPGFPYGYLGIGEFRRRFTRYHEWQFPVIWEGRYVIVSE